VGGASDATKTIRYLRRKVFYEPATLARLSVRQNSLHPSLSCSLGLSAVVSARLCSAATKKNSSVQR
jgi:hypothetical protein